MSQKLLSCPFPVTSHLPRAATLLASDSINWYVCFKLELYINGIIVSVCLASFVLHYVWDHTCCWWGVVLVCLFSLLKYFMTQFIYIVFIIYVSQSIHSTVAGHLDSFPFWLFCTMLRLTFLYVSFGDHLQEFLLGIYIGWFGLRGAKV